MTEMNTEDLIRHLRFNVCPIGEDYVREIAHEILDDVNEDIRCSADEDYNEDDIRLAVGRVLCDRLGIEV